MKPFKTYQQRDTMECGIANQHWPLFIRFNKHVDGGLYILRLSNANTSQSFKLIFE
jgi:hypothetical protein